MAKADLEVRLVEEEQVIARQRYVRAVEARRRVYAEAAADED